MKKVLFVIFCCLSPWLMAQENDGKKKKKQLDTEEITVTKSFSPTVSDAFKIKTSPQLDTVEILQKKKIDYSIQSVPVASTFAPAKGKPKALARGPRERFYRNFISLGLGNYGTVLGEAYIHGSSSNYNDMGGYAKVHSSNGGIDEVALDDHFLTVETDLFYKQNERYFDWEAHAGLNHNIVNWYGLPEDLSFNNQILESIDEKQSYTELYAKGQITFHDALIHKGDASLSRFVDKYNSAENHLFIHSTIDFPIMEELVYTHANIEFLNGKFENDFDQIDDIKYNYFNIELSPNFEILRDNLSVNVGAKFLFSMTNTDEGSKFYIYPNITASYNISDEQLIAFGGITGDLTQNSYRKFVDQNPFVSPTLDIKRTHQQYYGYGGLKGLLNGNINFNFKVAYGNEENKALFKLNPSKTGGAVYTDQGYQAGNSFQVVYDQVNTLQASAEVIVDFTQEFKFGGNVAYNNYSLDQEEHAWNLPDLTANLLAYYTKSKWRAGAELFFVSDRKDDLLVEPIGTSVRITNSSYFDINLNGMYHLNDKISFFLNANNLLNQNYQAFTNFKVQGLQVVGGVKFKFDIE